MTVAPKALKRAQERIRQLTTRNWSVSMERRIKELNRFTVGWTAYFCLADTFLPFDKLDKWLRRRLRQVRWKEWKRSSPAKRLLAQVTWPEGIPRPLPRFPGMLSEPPGADPHAGWCGRGAVRKDRPLCRSGQRPDRIGPSLY